MRDLLVLDNLNGVSQLDGFPVYLFALYTNICFGSSCGWPESTRNINHKSPLELHEKFSNNYHNL